MLNEYKHILVPVDGSKSAESTLLKAAEVALRNHAKLEILNVINTTSFGFSYGVIGGNAINDIVDGEIGYLKDLVKRVETETGFKDAHMHVRFGSPRNIISYDFPKEYQIDLIMMGATGKNATERLLVGSVASFVNGHAPCDVIVVRTDLNNKSFKK
ncbi:universal stress protein [Fructilactobacillus vespulae]|uniref:universal stress protein n=1 Tax=Fructilactobacillus vespulae TaxID=1249630 RepID=UPI0039B4BDE9